MIAHDTPTTGPRDVRNPFTVLRFGSEQEAERVAHDIDLLVKSELGGVFRHGRLTAIILRPATGDRGCLYFSNGALAAARLAGIRLPIADGFAKDMDVRAARPVAGVAA